MAVPAGWAARDVPCPLPDRSPTAARICPVCGSRITALAEASGRDSPGWRAGSRLAALQGEPSGAGISALVTGQALQVSLERADGLQLQVVIQAGEDDQPAAFHPPGAEAAIELGKGKIDESRGDILPAPPVCLSGNAQGGVDIAWEAWSSVSSAQRLHDHQGLDTALFGDLGCVDRIEGRRLADRRQQGGFAKVKLRDRFAKIQLGGGLRSVGVMTVVGAVQVPFQHLFGPVTGRDLRRQHAFMDAAQRWRQAGPTTPGRRPGAVPGWGVSAGPASH